MNLFWSSATHPKEIISKIYTLLNSYNLEPLTSLKRQWEEELDVELSEDMLQPTLDKIHQLP